MSKITVGMRIDHAIIIGGSYSYKVIRDEAAWPAPTNPLEIIRTQASKPDESKIFLTFTNRNQFDDAEVRSFVVKIDHGVVSAVEKLQG
jgi:hypothetical protein